MNIRPKDESFDKELFSELLLMAIDGSISEKDSLQLQNIIKEHPESARYYHEFMSTYLAFTPYGSTGLAAIWQHGRDEDLVKLLDILANDQESAPAIELPKPVETIEIAEVKERTTSVKITPAHITKGLLGIAAVILFAVLINLLPEKSGPAVATLSDTINAGWSGSGFSISTGQRLRTGTSPLRLRYGYVELTFDNETRVTLEGPAEFQILTDNQIQLNYGKLYAVVSERGYGFTVSTASSKITDLGTEFGVMESKDNGTEVHVIKGCTNLLSWKNGNKANVEINEGFSRAINAKDGSVTDIPNNTGKFVRFIDSQTGFLWSGQDHIDLADIVGGGNGFGTGKNDWGIDIETGQAHKFTEIQEITVTRRNYVRAADNKYIDGVCVPDGGLGSVQLSSTGLKYDGFEDTSGQTWGGVFNGAFHASHNVAKHNFTVNGRVYGYKANESIMCIHSNKAITFDLKAIRADLTNLELGDFNAQFAISETRKLYDEYVDNTINFRVFVDGEMQYEVVSVNHEHGLIDVNVPLDENNRFLTIAVTDAGDSVSYDWCYLKDARIELQ